MCDEKEFIHHTDSHTNDASIHPSRPSINISVSLSAIPVCHLLPWPVKRQADNLHVQPRVNRERISQSTAMATLLPNTTCASAPITSRTTLTVSGNLVAPTLPATGRSVV